MLSRLTWNLLCKPAWTWTYNRDPSASASQVQGLKVYNTIPGSFLLSTKYLLGACVCACGCVCACVCVCVCVRERERRVCTLLGNVPLEDRRGCQVPCSWSYRWLWADRLGAELQSFWRTIIALNCWPISPAPLSFPMHFMYNLFSLMCIFIL